MGVCRFAPSLLRHATQPLSLVAIGADDGAVSVWKNDLTRPFAVIKGASHNVVTDIAWSRDATKLLFTAGETCTAVEFTTEELGSEVLGKSEMVELLQSIGLESKKRLSMIPAKNTRPFSPTKASVPSKTPPPPSTAPAKTSTVSAKIPAPAIRSVAARETKKRPEMDETPEPTSSSRKRKKSSPPVEIPPPALPVEIRFPVALLELPSSQWLPGISRTVTLQAFSLTSSALQEESHDSKVVTLVQATANSGNLLWSWMGQGRVALTAVTSHHMFLVTRDGLLHGVNNDGMNEFPAVMVLGEPAAIDGIREKEKELVGVMTADGHLMVWKMSGHALELVERIDCEWMVEEGVTEVKIQFVGTTAVHVTINGKEQKIFCYELEKRCWHPVKQPIFDYSIFSKTISKQTLASPVSSNPVFTVCPSRCSDCVDASFVYCCGNWTVFCAICSK